MGNYGNHNRNLQIHYGGYTADELDTIRDNQRYGKAKPVKHGKTVHPQYYKTSLRDYSVDEKIASLLKQLNDPLGSKINVHYKLGCAYKAKGDFAQAKKHLAVAAKTGHSDAIEELDALSHT